MTDKELMQRAWDSLAAWKEVYPENWDEEDERLMDNLLTRIAELQGEALRARLSQCERCGEVNPAEIHTCSPQEPVAWVWTVNSGAGYITRGVGFDKADIPFAKHTPLYFAPPQRQQRTYTLRKWQGLTDEDWIIGKRSADYIAGAEWAEAKLKEKNSAT